MKVAIECRSPLLQKSLENFLEGHLSSPHSCDLLLSDEALVGRDNFLRIGSDEDADIVKPFSKSQLFLRLEQFYRVKEDAQEAMNIANELDRLDEGFVEPMVEDVLETDVNDLNALEEKIERLTASYVNGVMSLVKEYRGKK